MKKSVCFIGHRKIKDTAALRSRLHSVLQELIEEKGIINFIFGDNSAFGALCYESVSALKEKYPRIKRIHFRKDYENTDDYTLRFLLQGYEESVCPKGVGNAGRAGYAERDQAMIRESDICVFYYNESYLPPRRKNSRRDQLDYRPKSGTALAYAYAARKKKTIYNLYDSHADPADER